jgi:CheY-like chemotaxis protein
MGHKALLLPVHLNLGVDRAEGHGMSVSATQVGPTARANATAVVCDTSAFNLRFLRAAMTKLGYHQVIEAHDLAELVHKATVGQAELVVVDPAMEDGAGIDAIKQLRAAVPTVLIVAFCSDDAMARSVQWQGIITVPKRSILQLDALIAAIQSEFGLEAVVEPEAIPVDDVAIPVWDLVPSLVDAI